MGFMDLLRTALVRTSEGAAEPPGTSFHSISEPGQLSALFSHSENVPVVIFKHDPFCAISTRAYSQMARVVATIELIDVAGDRETSLAVAAHTGVKHESRQVIVLRNGVAVWHASHSAITANVVQRALERAEAD